MGNASTKHSLSRTPSLPNPNHPHTHRQRAPSRPALSPLDPSITSIDGGYLQPQGVYATQDYDLVRVQRLIYHRRVAPFYIGLPDFEEDWTEEELAKAVQCAEDAAGAKRRQVRAEEEGKEKEGKRRSTSISNTELLSVPSPSKSRPRAVTMGSTDSVHRVGPIRPTHGNRINRPSPHTIWKNALECPICFLFYPPNINHTRCCAQPICTECFVQIKRPDPAPSTTPPYGLESTPATCPFCVEGEFGVVYEKPGWAGERPGRSRSPSLLEVAEAAAGDGGESGEAAALPVPGPPVRISSTGMKTYPATHPAVTLTDHLRPNWESDLLRARARAARRAAAQAQLQNFQLTAREREREERRRLRREGREREREATGRMGREELEEMMVAEAMRLSLREAEDRQRRGSSSR
ncbi:SNF1-interacting protein [Saitoella coloradoensis]